MRIKIVSRETVHKITSIAILCLFLTNNFSIYEASDLYLKADAYAIADKNTGIIYDSNNLDEVHGIASLTKLMSAYVFFDKIDEEEIDLTTTNIPVSERGYALSQDPELSGVYFGQNDEYTLELMLNLMLVYSDNGATTSIAETLFGSEEEAVKLMNKKAEELGLVNSKFYNVTGLTMIDYGDYQLEGTTPEDYNVSTPREMLYLTQSLIEAHPEVMDYVSKSQIEFNGYTIPSFNLMLSGQLMEYDGVIGMKTGTSDEAGYCFVGYYINPNNQREYLSVILGADSISDRFNETAYMYNYVDVLDYIEVKADDNTQTIELRGAKNKNSKIKLSNDYYLKDEITINAIKTGIEYNDKYFDEDGELISNIPKGEVVLTYNYQLLDDEGIDFFQNSDSNVLHIEYVSDEEILKENFLQKVVRSLKDFIEECYRNIAI